MTKRTKDAAAVRPGAVSVGERRYYLYLDGSVTVRELAGTGGDGLAVASIPAPEGAQEISEERGLEMLERLRAQGDSARKERKRLERVRKRDAFRSLMESPGMTEEAASWLTGYRDGLEQAEQEAEGEGSGT